MTVTDSQNANDTLDVVITITADVDKEGSLLQALLVQAPAVRTLTLNPDGSYSYLSPACMSAQASLTVDVESC
jgi:hypothetical protein